MGMGIGNNVIGSKWEWK